MLFSKILQLGAVAAFSSHALAMAAVGTEGEAGLEAREAPAGMEQQQQPRPDENEGFTIIRARATNDEKYPGSPGRLSQSRLNRGGGGLPTIEEDPYGLLPKKYQRGRPLVYYTRDGERVSLPEDPTNPRVPPPMPKKRIGHSVRTFRAKRPIVPSAAIQAAA
ncbi:hypothetical protein PspLS_00218 [Pyricularia sp. CBS 133598]|nr:hypothetical protein PspLS_00218 [Pyricularia sp. CBS 133598]